MAYGFNPDKSKNDLSDVVRTADIADVVREEDIADVVRTADIADVVHDGDITFKILTVTIQATIDNGYQNNTSSSLEVPDGYYPVGIVGYTNNLANFDLVIDKLRVTPSRSIFFSVLNNSGGQRSVTFSFDVLCLPTSIIR